MALTKKEKKLLETYCSGIFVKDAIGELLESAKAKEDKNEVKEHWLSVTGTTESGFPITRQISLRELCEDAGLNYEAEVKRMIGEGMLTSNGSVIPVLANKSSTTEQDTEQESLEFDRWDFL